MAGRLIIYPRAVSQSVSPSCLSSSRGERLRFGQVARRQPGGDKLLSTIISVGFGPKHARHPFTSTIRSFLFYFVVLCCFVVSLARARPVESGVGGWRGGVDLIDAPAAAAVAAWRPAWLFLRPPTMITAAAVVVVIRINPSLLYITNVSKRNRCTQLHCSVGWAKHSIALLLNHVNQMSLW